MKASNENNGLRVAEKVSVGASVAGTLAAIWSQQMIVAAAPLTLALSLNLINRGKFQQKLEEDITAIVSEIDNRIEQVDKEVAGEMRSLQASVQDLSLASKTVDSQPTKAEISDLQKQFVSLQEALSNLTSSKTQEQPEITQNLATFDPTYVEIQLVELKAAVIELEGVIYQNDEKEQIAKLQADIAKLSAEFKERTELRQITELRQTTNLLQRKIAELPTTTASVDTSYLEQEINQLKQNLAQLNSEFKERESQQLSELRQITNTVQERLTTLPDAPASFNASELEQEINQLKEHLTQLRSEFSDRESQQLSELRQITNTVQERLAALPDAPASFNPSELEQEIQQLKEHLTQLKAEFRERELQQVSELRQITDTVQERLATLNSTTGFDTGYIERDIKLLKDYFAGLSAQVNERYEPQEMAEIRQIVESLQQNLAPQITELETVKPEFDPSYLEQENQQFKLEIASLKQQLTSSNEQVAMIPQLLESFAQMQQQLQELQEKTEKLTPKIPQFPPSKPPEPVEKKTDYFAISRFSQFSTYYNSGKLSLASILRMAEENGIGEEFQLILKVARQHQLTFDCWPTNLMVSPPTTRMLSVPSNCSKCLFVVSAKPSDEGKLKLWLSPNTIAKFYPTNKHEISVILGDDGWREIGKPEVENFATTLNQLLS
jgi:DNA repair exonuclease SbcCD ATPase subunit